MQNTSENPIGHNQPPSDMEILQGAMNEKHARVLDGAAKLIEAAVRIPDVIEDDETAGKASDYIKMVTGCRKNIETIRVSEKEPHLKMGRLVDGFFKVKTDLLDNAMTRAKRPLDNWLKKKAAEEQARRNEEAARLRRESEEQAAAAALLEKAKLQPQAESMLDQAQITAAVADKADKAAEAKPAEMAKSRGDSGALATLRTRWVGELTDIGTLDLEALRFHINPDALQKAINSFVAAGGRKLHGGKIYEKSETVVR